MIDEVLATKFGADCQRGLRVVRIGEAQKSGPLHLDGPEADVIEEDLGGKDFELAEVNFMDTKVSFVGMEVDSAERIVDAALAEHVFVEIADGKERTRLDMVREAHKPAVQLIASKLLECETQGLVFKLGMSGLGQKERTSRVNSHWQDYSDPKPTYAQSSSDLKIIYSVVRQGSRHQPCEGQSLAA